tara:strand:- start:19 stop:270 length:252 start_codon:yes stop_codon:yes gene_type:complete
MNSNELKMWQRLIVDDVTDKEFNLFIKDRYKSLYEMVNKYGIDKVDLINKKDYPDEELHKLIEYYTSCKNLLFNYIKKKSNER